MPSKAVGFPTCSCTGLRTSRPRFLDVSERSIPSVASSTSTLLPWLLPVAVADGAAVVVVDVSFWLATVGKVVAVFTGGGALRPVFQWGRLLAGEAALA